MEWILTQTELGVIEELDAEWQADLEHKRDVILSSIRGGFAYAFGPLFAIRDIREEDSCQQKGIVERVKAVLSGSCAINSYANNRQVLDRNNSLACDYREFADMESYDTVSYIFNGEDEDKSMVLAFKLRG